MTYFFSVFYFLRNFATHALKFIQSERFFFFTASRVACFPFRYSSATKHCQCKIISLKLCLNEQRQSQWEGPPKHSYVTHTHTKTTDELHQASVEKFLFFLSLGDDDDEAEHEQHNTVKDQLALGVEHKVFYITKQSKATNNGQQVLFAVFG